MIWVKAPQVSYVNEIVELVKVFYPAQQVNSILNSNEKFGEGHTHKELSEEDILLETGYGVDEFGTLEFLAFLWGNENLLCKHRNTSSAEASRYIHPRAIEPGSKSYNHIDEPGNCHNPNDAQHKKTNRIIKNGLKGCVFDLLKRYTGKHPKWGALTGIRPVKLIHEMREKGLDEVAVNKQLHDIYKLHPAKINLLMRTARVQLPLLDNRENKDVSIYIHIPFCSTRCHYCSFPSDLIHRVSDKMGDYVECLRRELTIVVDGLERKGTKVDTVYIGGGTPTVLDHSHLETLLKLVQQQVLDRFSIREYTVEAGRPDSLDMEKLKSMKELGVTRLSINPQSMNQETLDLIGRNHTVEDIIETCHQAREIGFNCINMDVILGLPGETPKHMNHTMQEIAALNPENITIHTLSVKRASTWKESFQQYDENRKGLAEGMANVCRDWIDNLGMIPYYLYRQKYMLDHLENIGYALPGQECLYNIQFMDEKRDMWAIGAGASSKIYYPRQDRLERIANVKNLDSYLSRIEEMIEKKQKVLGM